MRCAKIVVTDATGVPRQTFIISTWLHEQQGLKMQIYPYSWAAALKYTETSVTPPLEKSSWGCTMISPQTNAAWSPHITSKINSSRPQSTTPSPLDLDQKKGMAASKQLDKWLFSPEKKQKANAVTILMQDCRPAHRVPYPEIFHPCCLLPFNITEEIFLFSKY